MYFEKTYYVYRMTGRMISNYFPLLCASVVNGCF